VTDLWVRDVVPWCCRHKWTLRYIVFVMNVGLLLQILEIRGVL